MKRVYHPYWLWEDWHNGMWVAAESSKKWELLEAAAALMKDCTVFGIAMREIIQKWPYACEHNLTAPGINHRAFLGHCACVLRTGAPEDITRLAWHTLTLDEQQQADAEAEAVFMEWRQAYLQEQDPKLL